MVGILELSYNTPLTLYQGQSAKGNPRKLQRERLQARRSLWDY
jgi:hypothetical protein